VNIASFAPARALAAASPALRDCINAAAVRECMDFGLLSCLGCEHAERAGPGAWVGQCAGCGAPVESVLLSYMGEWQARPLADRGLWARRTVAELRTDRGAGA